MAAPFLHIKLVLEDKSVDINWEINLGLDEKLKTQVQSSSIGSLEKDGQN